MACFSVPCLAEAVRFITALKFEISSGHWHYKVLVEPTLSTTRQSQQDSFNKKRSYDVIFMVKNRSIYANNDVLCQRSDYYIVFWCNMRERERERERESIERVAELPWNNCAWMVLVWESNRSFTGVASTNSFLLGTTLLTHTLITFEIV